jgi:hypothetical protein
VSKLQCVFLNILFKFIIDVETKANTKVHSGQHYKKVLKSQYSLDLNLLQATHLPYFSYQSG